MNTRMDDPQAAVTAFLTSGQAFARPGPVRHVQTHGAHVFLCGDEALKIKRAVRYDYLDQSTPALRHALLLRELELNRPGAPMIYRDVVPITSGPDPKAGLELNGAGPPLEWALRMHRFAPEVEMTAVAASGGLTLSVAERLGRVVQAFHATCPVRHEPGDRLQAEILDELARVLAPFDITLGPGMIDAVLRPAQARLARLAPLLRDRAAAGQVRRVHGDLHLRNLLLIEGSPVLFDALEFDERLATCDLLYDLAFLLMDLCHRDLGAQANAALGAWLLAAQGTQDAGLAALPLFMAVRAAIRAMVLLQTDQATGQPGANLADARHYLTQAAGHLTPRPPVLIAIGGLSGSGKSVLARDLAAEIGACPGAIHLRTDTERKAPGPAVSYDPTARAAVYDRMLARASVILSAGHGVILDATFLDAAPRAAAAALARRHCAAFHGLWLTAPPDVLIRRVTDRRGDPSDADALVVAAQLARGITPPEEAGWITLDAGRSPLKTRITACALLAAKHKADGAA